MENLPTVQALPLDAVRIPTSRLRGLGDLEALRESITSTGLLQPIIVDRAYNLVCGLHRLEACRSLGWTHIAAVVEAFEGPRARLAEVDENLCRRELTVLERAEHIALRRALWEEMQAERAEAAAAEEESRKRKKAKPPEAPLAAFVDDTARRTGRAKAAVREELRIGELPEDVRAVARETPVSNNKRELLALTRMPQEEQRRAITAVKAGESKSVRAKTVKAAAAAREENVDTADCPFDLTDDGRPRDATESMVTGPAPSIAAAVSDDPSSYRDDPMSPWATPGGALERELTRAQIVRLVGDAQRTLARALDLWGPSDDEGRHHLRGAVDAVERLSQWMESPSASESAAPAWAASA